MLSDLTSSLRKSFGNSSLLVNNAFATPTAKNSGISMSSGEILDFGPVRQEMKAFEEHFKRWLHQTSQQIQDEKLMHQKILLSEKEKINTTQKQIERFESDEARLHQQRENEMSELNQLETSLTELRDQLKVVRDHESEWSQKVDEIRSSIHRRQINRKQREQQRCDSMHRREPELKSFETKLGLFVTGVRSDEMKFSFIYIDQNDWEKEFSFVIDVSEANYRVIECQPGLPHMSPLLERLNMDRDFYGFLKRVRKAFVSLAVVDGILVNKIIMKQASIKSFFSKSPKKESSSEHSHVNDDESSNQQRKRRVIQSDSENDEPEKGLVMLTKKVKPVEVHDELNKENASSSTESSWNLPDTEDVETGTNKINPESTVATEVVQSPAVNTSTASSIAEDEKEEVESEKVIVEGKPTKSLLNWFNAAEKNTDDTTEWKTGEPVSFAALCKTFEDIESTTKRLMILEMLTKLFVKIIRKSPDDLQTTIYLCINRLGPVWEGVELGIGETILMKAIAEATGRSLAKIKSELKEQGDLGKVAQVSRSNQTTMFQPKPLTVKSIFKALREIAAFSGNSSMNRKIEKIKSLLVACRNNEARYLIRALEGKLRIGLAEQTVLVALAHSAVLNKVKVNGQLETELAEAAVTLKQVYSELPYYEMIVPVLLNEDINVLPVKCKLTPGIPLKPMLAHPTKSISEVLNRFENMSFTCEYKYDGERAQIHKLNDSNQMIIFSRNQENMSEKYPDIMEHMRLAPKDTTISFVIDSEAVAWDKNLNKILPFQVLSTRKRKDVSTESITVQVCIFAFDLLYLNGESLIRKPFNERRKLLYDSFVEVPGKFHFAKQMDGTTSEDIQSFLDQSIDGNCEGLMVKTLVEESSYEPSKRSRNWLKVKKDYLDGAGDSLDLVVIGGYIGKGKRTGFYGGFLLACYDDDREEYQAICKIGTGFSEEDLAKHSDFFKQQEMTAPKSYYSCGDTVKPDVWFEPVQVWEVKTADLSISPVYTAAIGHVDSEKGISLRFPRFIRIRDDKTPDQATNASQVADMYKSQKINSVSTVVDDDFEY